MRIDESLVLAVKPDVLWPWISTPDRLSKWITDVERFEIQPPGELAQGSRLIAHLPRSAPIQAKVERVERGRALVLRASGLPNDLEVLLTFQVAEQEGKSILSLRAEAQLTGMLMFAEGLIASKARAKLAVWTAALSRAVGGAP